MLLATVQPATAPAPAIAPGAPREVSALILRWSARGLMAMVWLSTLLFGIYIFFFYGGALAVGKAEQWNLVLPRLYDPESPAGTAGIGLHFVTGAIILALGFAQFIAPIRDRFPTVHRWLGRIYVVCCLAAAVGGLVFIFTVGTIGGTVMDIGFGLYGVLMAIAAVQTMRHARAGRLEVHRQWAIRLFALAIGSWLYRMDYGFWLILANRLGHGENFTGPFDRVMAFAFYLPNLVVAEAYIRSQGKKAPAALRLAASAVMLGAAFLLLVGTYYFCKFYWIPGIALRFAG